MSATNILAVANVTKIGAGERLTSEVAAAVIAATPEGFDWTVRGAIPAAIRAALNVTAESEPRQKVGPSGDQRLTDYGRGFNTLATAIKRALKNDDDASKPVVLRATLSGEGGGSVTIDASAHPDLYAQIVALIAGE